MGKAEFYSIDLTSFEKLYFKDVHIVDCSFVNLKWKFDIDPFVGRGISKTPEEELLPAKIAKLRNEINEDYLEIENLKSDHSVLSFFFKESGDLSTIKVCSWETRGYYK